VALLHGLEEDRPLCARTFLKVEHPFYALTWTLLWPAFAHRLPLFFQAKREVGRPKRMGCAPCSSHSPRVWLYGVGAKRLANCN